MLCPLDNTDLLMTDRQGVEIDYCPKCRGVWLDRGELDKLIERAAFQTPVDQSNQDPNYQPQQFDKHGRPVGHNQGSPNYKRRKSLLGEMFDF